MIHNVYTENEIFTIESEDDKVLTAAIFILGTGHFKTKSNETDFQVPITSIGTNNGADWFKKEFKIDLKYFIKKNNIKIADCLTTIVKGNLQDRNNFFSNIQQIKNKKDKQKFIDDYIDNDIIITKSFNIALNLIDYN
jgi:hypothetical protein